MKFAHIKRFIYENFKTNNTKRFGFRDYINEQYNFDQYFKFLTENLSLDVIRPRATFQDLRSGFDKVKDPTIRKQIAKETRKKYKNRLLGDGNPKLEKEKKYFPHYNTMGLSLSPAEESGRINLCPCSTEECRAACLNKAGRGQMDSVQKARLNKTNFLLDNPTGFMSMLHDEIDTHTQHAAKRKQKALVRLNVVSDIPYESLHPEIFSQHPSVQFYDYTKIAGRVLKPDGSPRQLPPNYHLTLSSSGITGEESNWEDVRTHLNNGGVASMVFDVGKTGKLPTHVHDEETGVKYRVIDGDLHDHRHQDHAFNNINPKEGVIAGLKFKGSEEKAESATHFNVKVPVDKDHVSVPPANKRQKE